MSQSLEMLEVLKKKEIDRTIFFSAIDLYIKHEGLSVSLLQRHFKLEQHAAKELMDAVERAKNSPL